MKDGKAVIYLSGPMSGYPSENYPEFVRVTKILRDAGYYVLNRVEFDSPEFLMTEPHWRDYLARDLKMMLENKDIIDMVTLLDGWNPSRGSKAEVYMGWEILDVPVNKFKEDKGGFVLAPMKIVTEVKEIA